MHCCVRTNHHHDPISLPLELIGLSSSANKKKLIVSLESFSYFLESNLDWNRAHDDDDNNNLVDHQTNNCTLMPPVRVRFSEDAGWLQCEKPKSFLLQDRHMSLLGVWENQCLYEGADPLSLLEETAAFKSESELNVVVEAYRPSTAVFDMKSSGCRCFHPRYEWGENKNGTSKEESEVLLDDDHDVQARVKMIDLSQLQLLRRNKFHGSDLDETCDYPKFDSPGSICHLLRSVLNCGEGNSFLNKYGSHCASPWRDCCTPILMDPETEENAALNATTECDSIDQVICILLCNQMEDDEQSQSYSQQSKIMKDQYFWDELEQRELRALDKFRTSDACPNFYLYSVSDLKPSFTLNACPENPDVHSSENGYTLFVYRHLPRRPQFRSTPTTTALDGIQVPNDEKQKFRSRCLWEHVKTSSGESSLRMVAPPYQDINDIYGDLLNDFIRDDNLKILAAEANTIPQWTAWPEKNHYQSEYDDESNDMDSAYPASWTVFPLCHTFPASDVSKRQFIPLTCSFVPKTTELLKSLGPFLRTALFSRLEPRTTLGAHSGWSDLANHVLRVHIPLKVPSGHGNDGLCGTWVDGCVETHQYGRVICFDDSKIHRAFNYSDDDRIVLIIDLARPEDGFPVGTAKGGHTDELDNFIKQFASEE